MIPLLAALLLQTVPGAAWEERAPKAAGLDAGKLDALRDLAEGRGCVVRGGALAYSWGDVAKSADVASALKPVISTLLMIAVQEGKLEGVDAAVSVVQPRLIGKNRAITWRQLASQTSGYGLGEEPGAAYATNDFALALTYDTLMDRVYREAGTDVLRRRLASPLGFQDPCSFEAFGPKDRPGRLAISVRDFARFGLLVLRGGKWGERQLVTPGLMYLSISAPVPAATPGTLVGNKDITPLGPGVYSFHWWLNGSEAQGRQLFADGPSDLVAALGDGGKRALWILPSLDLVVAWNDATIDDHDRSPGNPEARINRAVKLMAESVIK